MLTPGRSRTTAATTRPWRALAATAALAAALCTSAGSAAQAAPASEAAPTLRLGSTTLAGTLLVVADEPATTAHRVSRYAIRTADGAIHPVDPAAQAGVLADAGSGDRIVARVTAVDGPATTTDTPDVLAADVTPVAAVTSAAVPLHLYVVAVADTAAAGDVGLAQADAAAQHSLAYWDRDGRGLWQKGTIARSLTWSHQGSCALDYWQLWSATSQLFHGVSFADGSGNHLVVFSPESCSSRTGYTGIADVGAGPSSSGTVQVVGDHAAALTHELGHNFSLGHSNLGYPAGDGTTSVEDYLGLYGPMAGLLGSTEPSSLDVAYQQRLGVPGAAGAVDRVDPSTGDVQADLSPADGTSGTRALTFTDGSGATWYAEYRSAAGEDKGTNYTTSWGQGELSAGGYPVYYGTGVRLYRLDDDANVVTAAHRVGTVLRTTYTAGQTFTGDGVSLRVVTDSGTGAHVVLTADPAPAPALAPTTVAAHAVPGPYGDAVAVTIAVTGGGTTPAGRVAFADPGQEPFGSKVLAADGSLTVHVSGYDAGPNTLELRYLGDDTHASSRRLVSFTVPKVASRTAIAVTRPTPTTAGKVVAHVSTATDVPATGTVAVYDGSHRLGSATLASGAAAVALPRSAPHSSHALSVRYAGTSNVAASAASSSWTQARSRTSVHATAPRVTAGAAGKVSVHVSAAFGTATGHVVVAEGSRVRGSATLRSGHATVTLPKSLRAGTHRFTVRYVPSSRFDASSATTRLTVRTRTSLSASTARTWTAGHPAAIAVRTHGFAAGTVELWEHGRRVASAHASHAHATIRPPRATRTGTHTFTVRYRGTATTAPASAAVKVVVRR